MLEELSSKIPKRFQGLALDLGIAHHMVIHFLCSSGCRWNLALRINLSATRCCVLTGGALLAMFSKVNVVSFEPHIPFSSQARLHAAAAWV